ncbi:SDR family oxidoreductase [Algoriphagus zhangzhouensis]|uniref:NAD(P)-dependent dehydrogenase, short-chain alcohol dehydrogenase family n=1 Tax=Algoriphagus zhangzhouensis TaxID=1073327 RepID=A0A1M7ZG64_9BACT|nr:SDR family oxidoreductase [Algoriphagus zhangzhouensis]TDY44920.1 NAD(P)-dependent dehydrogenase (short-subunit alcohol dehydrogenase family) [Algoriphagus zhangzhouensis]SHO63789.1 NAD(P)-dependent dehydrogenase, short-chain alcohol dehydrogenase family [Algoriphagus zhangzhouensis]
MRLEDKVIIVTGSTTGIGKAIAKRCVREGAKVVLTGLEENLGKEVLAEIGDANAVFHAEDISADGCADRLVSLAKKSFGKLDAIVNNAAWVVSSDIQTTDKYLLQKVIDVNTIAPFLLIQAGLEELQKSRGCVLNIGSVNAYSGEPNLLGYSISKGGLMTMTRNLGDALMRDYGVRVNQINPGWVLTERERERKKLHGLSETWYEKLPAMYAPSGRILWPEEIAAAAVYWLSDESGPISGQVVDLEQHPMIGRNAPKDTSTIN